MRYISLIFSLLIPLIGISQENDTSSDFPYPVTKIYDTDEYSAFTDLIRFKNAFYCSFRVGSSHVGGMDGKVRIIRSLDGNRWESVALLEKSGIDLRDPKLSVTPDGRLMVIIGGSIYDGKNLLARRPHVSFSDIMGRSFSMPEEIEIKPEDGKEDSWIWRVLWNGDTGYGMDYRTGNKKSWTLHLMTTKDGIRFDDHSMLKVNGLPNEATIRFDDKENMFVLIRREGGDKRGMIARSQPPYTKWKYKKLDFQLGGPNFLILDKKKWVIGSRRYTDDRKTQILVTTPKGKVKKTFILPSGGDTSYPGMLMFNDELWVTYYSGHQEGSNIYLTKIPLEDL